MGRYTRSLPLFTAVIAVGIAGVGFGGSSSDTVAMTIRPVVLKANERATATGVVGSRRPDQLVTIQFQPCGETAWREIAETQTHENGGWTVDVSPGIGGLIRAASGGATSSAVQLKQEPYVSLTHRPPGTFSIFVNAQRPFWHRRAVLQRYDAKRRAWVDVRSVLFTESGAPPGVPWVASETDKFKAAVPRGTKLRAKLPASQAKPCYLGATSGIVER